MSTSLKLAFAAALAVLVSSALGAYYNITRLVETDKMVAHTQEVLAVVAGIKTSILDEEMLQRTYLIGGRGNLLEISKKNTAATAEAIDQLEDLVGDNASQLARIKQLRYKLVEYGRQFQSRVDAMKHQATRRQPAPNIEDLTTGSSLGLEARQMLGEMEAEEQGLLAERRVHAGTSATFAYVTVGVTSVLGVLLLGVASVLTNRDIMRRREATESLRQAHRDMENRVKERTAELGATNEKLHTEIEQHQIAEINLRHERLRYLSLVEATTAIVWSTPASGEIVDDLPRWVAFTGQTPDETRGWGWLNAIHPDDREHTAQVWTEAVASKSMYLVEHRMLRYDGIYRHMVARAVPLLDDHGKVSEWVGVHVDITEQKQAQAALLDAKETAEAANRAKSEFLANMSHEIRTPMNGIMGMTDIALDTELTRDQRDCLEAVKLSADSLMTIINDILDFSKIEAGKVELDPQPFPLRDSLADMMPPLAMRANARGLELAYHVTPETPDALVGDWGRIRQVIVNLIGNALKFTYEGQILLNIETEVGEQAGVQLHFLVKDTGVGIPPDRLRAIFEPFTQADGSTTRKFGGTGLGLSISLRLVELMGGRIWAESLLDSGTTFHFTIQVARQLEQEPEITLAQLDALRVLLSGGSVIQKSILTEMLTQWRMRPTSISLTEETSRELDRARCAGESYALLLLDVGPQLMDNPDLLARICSHALAAKVPVVLLKPAGEKLDRVPESEGTVALEKPVRQSRLLETIQSLVTDSGAQTASVMKADLPAVPPAQAARPLKVLLVDDNRINQRICARLLERDGHQVTVASSGEEALAILARDSFDVCLMDVQMPGMDGLEATTVFRQGERETGRHLHMIALTAHAMLGDRERCLAAGLDDYLSKPVRPEELRKSLGAVPTTAQT